MHINRMNCLVFSFPWGARSEKHQPRDETIDMCGFPSWTMLTGSFFFSGSSLLVETSALCGCFPRLLTGSTKKRTWFDDYLHSFMLRMIFFCPLTSLGGFPQNSLKIWSKSSKTDGSKRPWWPHHTWKLLSWEPSWNEVMYLISVSIAPW